MHYPSKPNTSNRITLFTLPFAGGNKFSYRSFADHIPHFLNHVPLEYPGRGMRSGEKLVKDLESLTDDLYQLVRHSIDREDYIFYGHSMGGQLAWLLTHKIILAGQKPPLLLFISGTPGPSSLLHSKRKRYLLDRVDFIQELKDMDDNFSRFYDDEGLINYFEPILRADFMACENYTYPEGMPPLDIPITVFFGDQDDIEEKEIGLWGKETTFEAELIEVKGRHFFILTNADLIMKVIHRKIVSFHGSGRLYTNAD
jgi:surfactin synthase thioesterase subunit